MPDSGTYTIKSGDTLSKIAASLNTTVDALAEANGIRDRNKIAVGQVLKVPGAAPALFSTPAAPASDVGSDWAALIAKHGDAEAQADFAAGKRVVIALRNPTNTKVNRGLGRYDDRMIVVRQKNGALEAKEFACNTEPSGQYAWDGRKPTGSDINRDGKRDQGRLIAGTYHYGAKPGGHENAPAFIVRSTQTTERDLNQDGNFNEADGPGRIDPATAQRTMYIHRGGNDNTWSAGCQTIQTKLYDSFLASLGGQTSFSYVLIDLDD